MAVHVAIQPGFSIDLGGFKAMAESVYGGIQAVGVEVTSDTGHVFPADLVSIPVPTNNTVVWLTDVTYAFTDPLQPIAPVIFKVELGVWRTNNNYFPARRVTIGTATDGAGAFVGVSHVADCRTQMYTSPAWSTQDALAPSFYCHNHTAGFLGVVAGSGSGGHAAKTSSILSFFIARTTDAAGVATADGFTLIVASDYKRPQEYGAAGQLNPYAAMHIDTTRGVSYESEEISPRVGGPTPIISGTDVVEPQQCFVQTGAGIVPVYGLISLWSDYPTTGGELACANGSVFERNYVALGSELGAVVSKGTVYSAYQLAMLFE